MLLDAFTALGRIAKRPPEPLAHFLFGAICETAMIVARAEDQNTPPIGGPWPRSAASSTAW